MSHKNPIPSTLISDSTAVGRSLLTAADAAAALSALSLSWTEIAATAFAHTPGAVTGGVASVVSSRLHTELAGVIADDLSGGFLGPRHEIALPVDDGIAWSVAARINFTGLDSNGRVSLSLRRTTVQILGATIRDSGNLETFSDVAAPTSTITAGFASGDWLRLTRRGGIMEVYTGTGASLAAAVWTWRASIAVASGQLPLTLTVSMAQYSSAPSSPPLTSDAGPIYITSGAGGGGGGGGAPSGTGVVTVTSGVYDVPSSTDDVVTAGLSGLVGGVLGEAVIGDGAGSVQQTSADVSALLAATNAAAARAALCDRTISLAGLTATNGNGTAVAATGTLSYASGQTGAAYADYPRLVGAHGTSIWSFDASVRITFTGAASANTVASLGIGTTGSVYNSLVMIRLFGDGQLDGLDLSGLVVWSIYTPGTVPVNGTGWLRVRVQAGMMSFFTGVGATYAAAAWTLRYRAMLSLPSSPDTTYPSLGLALYQAVNPGPPGVQAVYSDLVIRDLP